VTQSGDPGTAPGGRRPWWRDVPTAVAVVGLIVALSFNTIGVWLSMRENAQTRRATEVNLLTQLDAFVNQAEQALNATEGLENRCDPFPAYTLTRSETARLFAALQYYDYMAWLFNDEHITLGPAKGFWAPNMLDAYRVGTTFQPDGEIDAKFSQLAAFQRTADNGLWPRDPCRVGAGQRPRDPD
jgi:hypothetical protein